LNPSFAWIVSARSIIRANPAVMKGASAFEVNTKGNLLVTLE
jgi:hypothetical protein